MRESLAGGLQLAAGFEKYLAKRDNLVMASPLPLAALIALAVVAISKSEKKWLTALFILGWTAAGSAVGIAIGFAFGSAPAAGGLAGILALVMGIGASSQRIWGKQQPRS
jgi:hypothetical protein